MENVAHKESLFASEEARQEFVRLLGGALAAFLCTESPGSDTYLTDGEEEPEADEPETLFEDHSVCSNFSSDQPDSLDFEQEEGS
jgi:hypothetical protein